MNAQRPKLTIAPNSTANRRSPSLASIRSRVTPNELERDYGEKGEREIEKNISHFPFFASLSLSLGIGALSVLAYAHHHLEYADPSRAGRALTAPTRCAFPASAAAATPLPDPLPLGRRPLSAATGPADLIVLAPPPSRAGVGCGDGQ